MAIVEPIAGPTLTMVEFWIDGLYINFINNPSSTFAKHMWADLKDTWIMALVKVCR